LSTLAQYETISTKIPAELKQKIKRHGINASRIMRESLEREVAKAEAAEIDERLENLAEALDRIDLAAATRGIREGRDRR